MIKWILKLGITAVALLFLGVYFIRATNYTGVEIEPVEVFKKNNKTTIASADRAVRGIENEVKNFEWEKFKEKVSNLITTFQGEVDSEISLIQESQNQLTDNLGNLDDKLIDVDNDFDELEEQFDGALKNQEDYQEKIDLLENKIQEVLMDNKDKDKKRLRLVNGKKISRLEKKLFRTKDPIKKEKLRELIKALSGED